MPPPTQPFAPYPAYPAQYAAPLTARRRTGWMITAQVLLIVQAVAGLLLGVLCVAFGVYILIARRDLGSITSISGVHVVLTESLLGTAAGVIIGVGVVVIALSGLWLWGGIATGRPSSTARWVMAIFTILITLADVGSLLNSTNRGQAPPAPWCFSGTSW